MHEGGAGRPLRVALYSHDTMGLGHLRRNIAIASSIVTAEEAAGRAADVLLLSGARETAAYPLPAGVDCLTLPALAKGADGYGPRSLHASLAEVVELRAALLRAALERFAPDVLVVDKVARGVCRELEPALTDLHALGRTRLVLGLRDVLDEPAVTAAEWERDGALEAMADLYDAVWWYGDRAVLDPVAEYGLPPRVARRLRATGYLAHGRAVHAAGVPDGLSADGGPWAASRARAGQPYVLCMVGGGQDGAELARAFAAADLPAGHRGVLLTGPYLPRDAHDELARAVRRGSRTDVLRFTPDVAPLVAGAAAVVAMGGYNTVCEVLAAGRPALVVPRVHPRVEQLIRADRLSALGLLDVLHPDALTPAALAAWSREAVGHPGRPATAVDLDGLARLPALVHEVLGTGAPTPRRPREHEELPHGA